MILKEKIKKSILFIKSFGVKVFLLKIYYHFTGVQQEEKKLDEKEHVIDQEKYKQVIENWGRNYKISVVVPVYRTKEKFLADMIRSVMSQSYENWELCIADGSGDNGVTYNIIRKYCENDERIKVLRLEKNEGIAGNTNFALKMATGEFIGLLDHDDFLAPNALYEIVKELNSNADVDILYTDEDKVSQEGKRYFEPNNKPDFDMELFKVNNYICHFFVVKKEVVKKTKGFQSIYNGAQDYDFIFQCLEVSKEIRHIPKILYHWRVHESSTSSNPDSKSYAFEAGRRTIQAHLDRNSIRGKVKNTFYPGFYEIDYLVDSYPMVSILYWLDDKKNLKRDINRLKRRLKYPRVEILVISDKQKNRMDEVLKNARGKYLLFLRQGIIPNKADGLVKMVGYCENDFVGCVCGKVYCKKSEIIQGTVYKWQREQEDYISLYDRHSRVVGTPFHRENLQQEVDAGTMDCLMISKKIFKELVEVNKETISLNLLSKQNFASIESGMKKMVYYPEAEFKF